MIWPETMSSAAFAKPMSRGRRCVPPAPGTMPRLASADRPVRRVKRRGSGRPWRVRVRRRGCAVDRDDYWLGGIFERGEERREIGTAALPCRDRFGELIDIGAGHEGASAADEDDGGDGGVGDGSGE